MWDQLSLNNKLRVLAGESTVMVELLAEDEGLLNLLRDGASKEEALTHINENF